MDQVYGADVCIVVVSHNSRRWLEPCLTSILDHAGGLEMELIVVDNGTDGAADFVEDRFPGARAIRCPNRGFGHANNRALESARARHILFLNPDTEVVEGSLGRLVAELEHDPVIGLVGVRQVRSDGTLAPTIRRFPALRHSLAEALGVERVPGLRLLLGERELDPRPYERRTPCDWTSGSFLLVRRDALESAGWFDERFFLYSEETDLCWRLSRRGWQVVHMPQMTIRHYEPDEPDRRLEAQSAFARMQFARKHLALSAFYRAALALRYGLRAATYGLPGRAASAKGEAARAALTTVLSGASPLAGDSAPR